MKFDPTLSFRQEANDGQIRAIEERSISCLSMHLAWERIRWLGLEIHLRNLHLYLRILCE